MRTLEEIPVKATFPVVYWRAVDMYTAQEPANLYVGSRSILNSVLREDRWHLIDCTGCYYDISEWEEIKPFGGLKFWFERLMRMAFAVPILVNGRQLSLEDVKKTLMQVAEDNYRHDIEPYALADIKETLPRAESYLEAIQAISKATNLS